MLRYKHLTEHEVNAWARPDSSGVSGPAEQWRSAGDVFAIRVRDTWLYPSFQFADERPKPGVRSAVREFRSHGASDWELALWFGTQDPSLRATPADLLDGSPGDVARAARRVFETPV
jgi:hypothetical protein